MIKRKRSLYRYLSESLPEKERALFQEYACLASHLATEREDDAWAADISTGHTDKKEGLFPVLLFHFSFGFSFRLLPSGWTITMLSRCRRRLFL